MTSRRPPSQRNAEYIEQRQSRQLQSFVPGADRGRLASAQPIWKLLGPPDALFGFDGGAVAQATRASKVDIFTLPSDGAQDLTLTFVPVEDSWNLLHNRLGLVEGEHFTIDGLTVSLLTSIDPLTGDTIRVQYDYLVEQSDPIGDEAFTDPSSIPGLLLWLSADAITGYSDNALMTTVWEDQSGNGFDGTPVGTTKPKYRTATGSAGGPAVEFTNSGYFTFGDIMGSAAAGEIMATVRSDDPNTSLWAFGVSTGNSDEAHYPFSGVVYESFGLGTGQRMTFAPSLAVNTWRRYNVWSAAGDWAALLDETSQTTAGGTTVAWETAPVIGAGKKNSAVDVKFTGMVGCVLVYDRKLTDAERADVAAWLTSFPSGGTP